MPTDSGISEHNNLDMVNHMKLRLTQYDLKTNLGKMVF